MICSVLIPTRTRPKRLRRTIQSIIDTAANIDDIEICVRIDDDDAATLTIRSELLNDDRVQVQVIVGPRLNGYASLSTFYDELVEIAYGDWLFIMNDDAHIVGTGWDEQLRALPTTGVIAQPEIYQLGESRYPRCEGGAFPVVPNGCWLELGHTALGVNVDTWLDTVLRRDAGWRTEFLAGIEVVHERDDDAALAVHRAL